MANALKNPLTMLRTLSGFRSVYDSVCFCNRCGFCASDCPSYQYKQQEPFSPRGRNQALRQILTGKIKPKRERDLLEEMVVSCALCGRCAQHCPGEIPTVEHVLESRRRTGISLLPRTLFWLLRLRGRNSRLFATLIKIGFELHRIGVLRLLAWVPGFAWVKHASEILPRKAPAKPVVINEPHPTLIYLPSLEAEFLSPGLFEQTYKLASQQHEVAVWSNMSSGLFEYTYGNIRLARKLVRRLIVRHANIGGNVPLLTDSIEVYGFLKRAPQLFANLGSFEEKAKNFAACVHFITDFLSVDLKKVSCFSSPVGLIAQEPFYIDTTVQSKAKQILHTLFKKNFVECDYKAGVVPSLGYGFVKHTYAPAYALSAVQGLAAHQTQTVFVLSGLAALELAFYVRTFYPTAQVRHLVELNG